MPESPFTELLKQFVKRRNLPIERLATISNLSRKTLYRWMNNEVDRPRHWSQIVALASALRLSESETDHLLSVSRHPSLDELIEFVQNDYERKLLENFEPAIQTGSDAISKPRPYFDSSVLLEFPSGAVHPQSPFYISRKADTQLIAQILGTGTTTTIRAPRQTGKTSLLMQGIHQIKERQRPFVYLDFQEMDAEAFSSLDQLLRVMAGVIADQLGIPFDGIDTLWLSNFGPVQKFNRYLQREILPNLDQSLLIAIDEADQLLGTSYKKNFFSLLRAWDARRAYDDIWRKLNLVMVISTHPYLLIDDVNLSPFNVGVTISLEDFTADQIAELNRHYGEPLTLPELNQLIAIVGGHPYLVRQALYTLVSENISPEMFQEIADKNNGPFGRHLRFYWQSLQQNPELSQAFLRIVDGQKENDETKLDRLMAVGLIKKAGDTWVPRCELYRLYFQGKIV